MHQNELLKMSLFGWYELRGVVFERREHLPGRERLRKRRCWLQDGRLIHIGPES